MFKVDSQQYKRVESHFYDLGYYETTIIPESMRRAIFNSNRKYNKSIKLVSLTKGERNRLYNI
jgi:hypothetical protein